MKPDPYIRFGTVTKTHGLKGQILVYPDLPFSFDPRAWSHIWVEELPGQFIPSTVLKVQPKGNGYIFTLEGVHRIEEAGSWIKKGLFVPDSWLRQAREQEQAFLRWVGYEVLDEEQGSLGTLQEIKEYPAQIIGTVHIDSKEILLPLHPDFIVSVDQKGKVLHTRFPEGIVSLT